MNEKKQKNKKNKRGISMSMGEREKFATEMLLYGLMNKIKKSKIMTRGIIP